MNREVTKYGFYSAKLENPRQNNFNLIRFFAALMVVYGHMTHIMGVPLVLVMGNSVSTIGVQTIFLISGYLICKSYFNDNHFGRYMVRRCFRIFPGLIAVVLFSIFVLGPICTSLPLSEYFTNIHTYEYLKNIILYPVYVLPGVFQNAIYPNAVNGSLWSMPVEFTLYLLLVAFVLIFQKLHILKQGTIACAGVFSVLYVVFYAFFPDTRFVLFGTNWVQALSLVPFFLIGATFSLFETNKFLNAQLATVLFIGAMIVPFSGVFTVIVPMLVLPYFVFSLSFAPTPVFQNCFTKCDFSYGIYLYGFAIQQALQQWFTPYSLSLNLMTLICCLATLLLAIPSWYLIEKPAQELGKKILKWSKSRESVKKEA